MMAPTAPAATRTIAANRSAATGRRRAQHSSPFLYMASLPPVQIHYMSMVMLYRYMVRWLVSLVFFVTSIPHHHLAA